MSDNSKITLKKKYHNTDKFKKKIHTPRECVIPTIKDGWVIVHPKKRSSVKALARMGFELVKETKRPAKRPSVMAGPIPGSLREKVEDKKSEEKVPMNRKSLKALTVKELLDIAKGLEVVGRHKMREDELIDAILSARG